MLNFNYTSMTHSDKALYLSVVKATALAAARLVVIAVSLGLLAFVFFSILGMEEPK